MAAPQKKAKIEKDRYTPDGVRLFNPSKEHGVVYYDAAYGDCPTKFIQEFEGREVQYKGDGTPTNYVPGQPLPQPVDAVEAENTALKARIADLEAQSARTNALLERLSAQLDKAPAEASPEAPTSGAAKPKK